MSGDAGATDTFRVQAMDSDASIDELEPDTPYLATVNGVVPYGIFVDVSESVSGLVHESTLSGNYEVGDTVVVELVAVHDDGDVAFDDIEVSDYEIVDQRSPPPEHTVADVTGDSGNVTLIGRVDQIKQTGGPTVITLNDGTGLLGCAAFEAAGVRAYPDIAQGDFVRITGEVSRHEGELQLEVETLTRVDDPAAVEKRLEERLAERAVPATVEPLIDWPALEAMWPSLESLAQRLRRMILENRPVRIRHHADGDGMCAAVPLELALERFAREVHDDPNAPRHLIRRSPAKAPFYELEDAVRDLNFALEDRARHGQRLPLVLMLDNGSTEEDVPAYRNLAHYDIPIAVVDHHHPDPDAVADLLDIHVNPYLHGEDYRITTGMLCVEVARLIDPAIGDDVRHVPAVAGLADRSEAEHMSAYIELAGTAGYDLEDLQAIGRALDYAAHWLKYRSGTGIVRDVLDVKGTGADHEAVRELLASGAEAAMNRQLEDAIAHVESQELANGATLHRLDLDAYTHRFEYPAPGKTTGAIHDQLAAEEAEPVITVGFGPDFAVLRSDGVVLDIPAMVDELDEALPGAGVSGGGHLVVGSIHFVRGRRDDVLSTLTEKMAAAEIDPELTSTADVPTPDS